MNKYLHFLIFIVVLLGAVIFAGRLLSGEDSWICRAGAWSLHGRPYAGVPTKTCDGKNTVYLDVRTAEEWNRSHIKGAVYFELSRLEAGEAPDIPKDANLQIYCRSGSRAETAKAILKSLGFTGVVNAGGLEDLLVQGFPVEY